MKIAVILVAIVTIGSLHSCCLVNGLGKNNLYGVPKMRDVSGRLFEIKYGAPRTRWSQWRYRGIVGDYHVLDYYNFGTGDWLQYQYSIRTRRENLTPDFPSKAQPPVKASLNQKDKEYFQMAQEEIRREQEACEIRMDASSWREGEWERECARK